MRNINSLKGTPMSVKLINITDLVACALIALAGGYYLGFTGATNHYKHLFRTSYTSDDPAEVDKATKTLCRKLHLKVQYPDEN